MKHKRIIVGAMLLFAVLAGIGLAFTPPPPPPPPVPQKLGLFDTSIAFLQTNASDQSACRVCHQTSGTNTSPFNGTYNNTIGGVPTRHHNMLPENVINPFTNTTFGCTDCHPSTPGIGNGILLDRSCTDCHNATNFFADVTLGAHVGNLSRPHHFNTTYDDAGIGNPASNRQCKTCHGKFVDNFNDGHNVPDYASDLMITPMGSFKVTNFSQPLPQLFHSDGTTLENKTWGGCESCHLGTINATGNSSLAALGQFNGTPILDNHDTHHQTILDGGVNISGTMRNLGGRTPNATCSWCHVINPTNPAHGGVNLVDFINPFTGENVTGAVDLRNSTINATSPLEPGTINVTINGTGCEKCHSIATIHNINGSTDQFTQGVGHITNNVDCYGCHNEWLPSDTNPFAAASIPTLSTVSPSVISAGAPTTLTITGANFVNDVTNPDGTVTSYTSVVIVDGVSYTPSSITDAQITVTIPALTAGVHQLQLLKGTDTPSLLTTLTAVPVVSIGSAKISSGTLTLTGTGFGTKPATNSNMYVSVNHAGNTIVVKAVTSWSNTNIKANVKGLSIASGDVVTVMTTNAGESKTTIS